MSRTLTNFLLMETIFDNINPVNSTVYSFANRILSPTYKVVSEDCGTKLGRVLALGPDAVGKISLLTYGTFEYTTAQGIVEETIEADDELTTSKVTALLTNQSSVATRSISTCTAPEGICRRCLLGSYREEYPDISFVPAVGTSFKVDLPTKRSFLTYLAETHVGGLLGMEPLQTEGDAVLPVREELIRSKIQEGELALIFREVSRISSMDSKLIEYARDMDDKLQKALFLILLYGVFINVKL